MRNDVQGSFQGGSLNFLYHLAKETGDRKWTGERFVRIADHFIRHIQQPSGYFSSVERSTKKPPDAGDPQGGLHRANDDLGTLGLLAAHRVTGNREYLAATEKFLGAVFAAQRDDGQFEDSVAPNPVVLNVLLEGEGLIRQPAMKPRAIERLLESLFAAQSDGGRNPRTRGALFELGALSADTGIVCARSSCYALIVLPKLAGGSREYLTAAK
jgi:hypothetical protein